MADTEDRFKIIYERLEECERILKNPNYLKNRLANMTKDQLIDQERKIPETIMPKIDPNNNFFKEIRRLKTEFKTKYIPKPDVVPLHSAAAAAAPAIKQPQQQMPQQQMP